MTMTPTQTKAMEVWNTVRALRKEPLLEDNRAAYLLSPSAWEAICRLIDEHEDYKQDVSDAVEGYIRTIGVAAVPQRFARFIIPKPDPITEWLRKSGYEGNAAVEQAVRAYAKEQGE